MYPPHQRTSKSISAVKKRKDRLPPQLTTVLQWQDLHKKKPSRLSCQCHDNRLIRKRPLSGNQKHRTSLGKSTEVLHRKYGGFMQRSPMFLNPHIHTSGGCLNNLEAVSTSPQKSFMKKTYISYTAWRKIQQTKAFSGEG